MAAHLLGEIDISLVRDQDGHRDYTITWRVVTDNKWEGPRAAMNCPGLPKPGAMYYFDVGKGIGYGEGQDNDPYAYCQGECRVTAVVKNAPNYWWDVEQKFSTRPFERLWHDGEDFISPLAEPPRYRGGFTKRTEEVWLDANNKMIRNSSWDRIGGKACEFDKTMPNITVTQYMPFCPAKFYYKFMDHVNDAPCWGFPERSVKLSDITWEKLYWILNTPTYLTHFEFEVLIKKKIQTYESEDGEDVTEESYVSGHDREVLNTSDKVIVKEGDPENPSHFEYYKNLADRERSSLIINTDGTPWIPQNPDDKPPTINIEYYPEIDFMEALGIPTGEDVL